MHKPEAHESWVKTSEVFAFIRYISVCWRSLDSKGKLRCQFHSDLSFLVVFATLNSLYKIIECYHKSSQHITLQYFKFRSTIQTWHQSWEFNQRWVPSLPFPKYVSAFLFDVSRNKYHWKQWNIKHWHLHCNTVLIIWLADYLNL